MPAGWTVSQLSSDKEGWLVPGGNLRAKETTTGEEQGFE